MMNIQKYLFSFPSIKEGIEKLKECYHINVKKYDNLYCFKYNQIESTKTDPIVQECRGLILDKFGNIVCRPFDRFFNYGEIESNKSFDFSKATILSKEDGSLLKVYFYDNKWNVGTSGTAFAESDCSIGVPFLSLVERVLEKSINLFMINCPDEFKDYTFLFELTVPENRVVKPYHSENMFLIGIRNNNTGKYKSFSDMKWIIENCFNHKNVKLPKKYDINSFEEVQELFDSLNEMDEGVVCWNEDTGERIKIKTPSYIYFHHLRDNGVLNPKRIAELVYLQDYEEYLNAFSEDKVYFIPYISAYSSLLLDINTVYEENKNIENQKEFALNVIKHPFNSILFQMRKGEDLYKCLKLLNSDKKLALLENYLKK